MFRNNSQNDILTNSIFVNRINRNVMNLNNCGHNMHTAHHAYCTVNMTCFWYFLASPWPPADFLFVFLSSRVNGAETLSSGSISKDAQLHFMCDPVVNYPPILPKQLLLLSVFMSRSHLLLQLPNIPYTCWYKWELTHQVWQALL